MTVFTPFKKAWTKVIEADVDRYLGVTAAPTEKQEWTSWFDTVSGSIPESLSEKLFPRHPHLQAIQTLWPASESEARKRMAAFVNSTLADGYDQSRNFPARRDGTSRLSAYLSVGMISARECVALARRRNAGRILFGTAGLVTWISELCWRDFYRHILFHFPRVCMYKPFKLNTDAIPWRKDPEVFERWCKGQT